MGMPMTLLTAITARCRGGATFAAGAVGQGFSFDGVDDGVAVNAASNLNVGAADGLTIDAWIFPRGHMAALAAGSGPIVEYLNGVHLWQHHQTVNPLNGLYVDLYDTNGAHHFFQVTGVITQHAWNHVAVTYSKATGIATLYVNGSAVVSQNLGLFTPQTSTDLRIGRRPPESFGAPASGFSFNGLIDEVEIYNRALSAEEIAAIFNAGSGGKCKTSNLLPVAQCKNVTVNTDPGVCSASASVNNDSFDLDGGSMTLAQSPPGPYGLGATNVTLTVTDDQGASDSCTATVTVVDNQAPSITCPAPQTTECTGPGGATASFTATVTDNCSGAIGISCTPGSGSTFPVGSTSISCTATDGSANSSSCGSSVTVVDTAAPVISSAFASPNVLWPPNHKMVPVTVAVSASDLCDAALTCQILSVTSNEPVDGLGDGDTAPDWQITGPLTVNLRAERSGKGSGRVYTITVQCSDDSGNSSTKTTTVMVPHDQRK
jgi:hypothetical protein